LVSQSGMGSIFTLTIDAGNVNSSSAVWNKYEQAEKAAREPQQEKAALSFAGMRALVVEDNPSNQKLIKLILEKQGLTVVVAENGKIGVDCVSRERFDIILMDIQMPVMNGFEATNEMRRLGIKTPIIAVTANAIKGDREKCLEAGCDEYVTKPIEKAKLLDIMTRYIVVAPC